MLRNIYVSTLNRPQFSSQKFKRKSLINSCCNETIIINFLSLLNPLVCNQKKLKTQKIFTHIRIKFFLEVF